MPGIIADTLTHTHTHARTHTTPILYLGQLGSSVAVHKLTSPPEECQWVVLGCESDSHLDWISRERGYDSRYFISHYILSVLFIQCGMISDRLVI